MIVQSITIPLVLFYQANLAGDPETMISRTFYWLTMSFLALTLLLTVTSSIGYVNRAVRLIRKNSSRIKSED